MDWRPWGFSCYFQALECVLKIAMSFDWNPSCNQCHMFPAGMGILLLFWSSNAMQKRPKLFIVSWPAQTFSVTKYQFSMIKHWIVYFSISNFKICTFIHMCQKCEEITLLKWFKWVENTEFWPCCTCTGAHNKCNNNEDDK